MVPGVMYVPYLGLPSQLPQGARVVGYVPCPVFPINLPSPFPMLPAPPNVDFGKNVSFNTNPTVNVVGEHFGKEVQNQNGGLEQSVHMVPGLNVISKELNQVQEDPILNLGSSPKVIAESTVSPCSMFLNGAIEMPFSEFRLDPIRCHLVFV